jgi:mRNA interferase MazF
MQIKSNIHNAGNYPIGYKEGEIWWCSIGENVGFEEDGKGQNYLRPALILKIHSRRLFFGVPLSTTDHRGKFYYPFSFDDKVSVALLSQSRTMDSGRLYRKMGRADSRIVADIRKAVGELLNLK